ncbi:MAG: hypothetical protein M3Y85_02720 [Bacteroidota bacterium]|nr:hypothetical protein [Bacteroidota bacterium]
METHKKSEWNQLKRIGLDDEVVNELQSLYQILFAKPTLIQKCYANKNETFSCCGNL